MDTKSIRDAYYRLAVQHHPDRGGDVDKMVLINRAWEILSSDKERKDYELRLMMRSQTCEADLGQLAIQTGDLLVLCSDGVWEHVPEEELWDTVCASRIVTAARHLTAQAVQRGGAVADNATLILLRAEAAEAQPPSWLRGMSESLATWLQRNAR